MRRRDAYGNRRETFVPEETNFWSGSIFWRPTDLRPIIPSNGITFRYRRFEIREVRVSFVYRERIFRDKFFSSKRNEKFIILIALIVERITWIIFTYVTSNNIPVLCSESVKFKGNCFWRLFSIVSGVRKYLTILLHASVFERQRTWVSEFTKRNERQRNIWTVYSVGFTSSMALSR